MIVVSLVGLKKSGKTATAEALISEFKSRGYRVGGVKFMPKGKFTLDVKGKDTRRQREAGAEFVISLSPGEVAFIGDAGDAPGMRDALRFVPEGTQILICEGLTEDHPGVMRVLTARAPEMIEETMRVRGVHDDIIAFSGIMANNDRCDLKHPVYNCLEPSGVKALCELILKLGDHER
jgi:molybdopterin-guanine dinucleotide biosynthesis protein MobB